MQLFSGPTQILPSIRSIPTPEHTSGHDFYSVESNGEAITFVGDLVHVESMQFEKPSVTIHYDVNQAKAAEQRIKQFSIFSKSRELVAGVDLPFPGMGHIDSRNDGAYRFTPANYRNR